MWMAWTSYDNNSMCDNYWWYIQAHNSAYALVKDGKVHDKQDSDLLRTISEKAWSTGPLLSENAAICECASLISQSAAEISYITNYNGRTGFLY